MYRKTSKCCIFPELCVSFYTGHVAIGGNVKNVVYFYKLQMQIIICHLRE